MMIESSAELTMVNTARDPGWAHFELWLVNHGYDIEQMESKDVQRAARLFYEWGRKPEMEPGLDL